VAPSLLGEIVSDGVAAFTATVAAGAAVVMSADALITGTADAYVANQNDKATLSAVESQVAAENNAKLNPPASTSQQGAVNTAPLQAEHTSGKRPSTEEKHEAGQSRRGRDQGGEKGDAARQKNGMWPRRPPGEIWDRRNNSHLFLKGHG
jgi:hypothetical protein